MEEGERKRSQGSGCDEEAEVRAMQCEDLTTGDGLFFVPPLMLRESRGNMHVYKFTLFKMRCFKQNKCNTLCQESGYSVKIPICLFPVSVSIIQLYRDHIYYLLENII